MFFASINNDTPISHGLNQAAACHMPSMAFGHARGRVLMLAERGPDWFLLVDDGDGLEYLHLHKIGGEWVCSPVQVNAEASGRAAKGTFAEPDGCLKMQQEKS